MAIAASTNLGWPRSLALAVLVLGSAPALPASEEAPVAMVTIALELRLGEKLFEPERGFVELMPLPGAGDDGREVVSIAFPGVSLRKVELPTGSRWRMQGTVEGYWSPTLEFTVGPVGATELRRLFWWPAGTLAAKLRVPKGERMPESVVIEGETPLHKASSKARPRKISQACPVDREGNWSCAMPAARFDLRVRSASFVPHYFWRLRIPRKETRSLGLLQLKLGASVVGTVEVEEGRLDPATCVAKLLPIAPRVAGSFGGFEVRQQLAKTERTTSVDERGFFQFEGISPGSYLLQVEQPGYSPAQMKPLEVWPKSESALQEPLVLRRPLDLAFQIHPPLDWLQQRWKVRLQRRLELGATYDESTWRKMQADSSGRLRVEDQRPGRYDLTVFDSLDNPLYGDPDLFIEGPESAHQEIHLELVDVQGELSFRDEPLAATLWFGGRSGARHSKMVSDEDGHFEGILPRGGTWVVEIESREPSLKTSAKVVVHPTKSRDAKVRIELPDTELFGRVVDETGQSVDNVSVALWSSRDSLFTFSGEDGEFEFLAPPLGWGSLYAEARRPEGTETSDPVQLEVVDGQPGGPYELRLRPTMEFTGQILSERGPVPGAIITWSAQDPELVYSGGGRSGLDGKFSGRIDRRSRILRVTVSPPGHALTAALVEVGPTPAVIWVGSAGGTLRLRVPLNREEVRDRNATVLFFQNGIMLDAAALADWRVGHGLPFSAADGEESLMVVPRMAPGQYRLCILRKAARSAGTLDQQLASTSNCASGYLGAGSTLELTLNPPD